MSKVVVGLYDRIEDARDAVQELIDQGFRREDISLVAADESGKFQKTTGSDLGDEDEDVASGAAAGAGIGAVLGGLGGLLVGLGALAIPGIGPVLAAGPLVSALAGAGIGAAAGGLVGALVDLGVPDDQADKYAEGVRRGGTLVTVSTADDMAGQAVAIMNRHNPVDIEQRYETWNTQTAYRGDTDFDRSRNLQGTPREGGTFEVVEEELRVGKREVDTGGVRVESHVTEQPVEKDINLREEHVDVERHPVDRPASPEDLDTFQEGTFEVRATSEEPVVEKRARVVEEVEVHKDVDERQETIADTVRRKDVEVQDLGGENRGTAYSGDAGLDQWEPMWRSDYQTNYSHMGRAYEDFRPAYNYGYTLANDPRYRSLDWDQIEPAARRDWETSHHDSPWDDFKDAVRSAWMSVRNRL